jgi:hypothetical protein
MAKFHRFIIIFTAGLLEFIISVFHYLLQPQMVIGYIRQEYKIYKNLVMSDEFRTEKVSEICDLE